MRVLIEELLNPSLSCGEEITVFAVGFSRYRELESGKKFPNSGGNTDYRDYSHVRPELYAWGFYYF